jgi:osmotically-inducible protein OsmY
MAIAEKNRDMRIESRSIEVRVLNGEATLKGKVDSLQKKRLAEENALEVTGIERVNNKLEVDTDGNYPDEKLYASILAEIQCDENIHEQQVVLKVNGGRVAIHGRVGSYVARKRIVEIAQHTPGVLEIDNQVVVNQK